MPSVLLSVCDPSPYLFTFRTLRKQLSDTKLFQSLNINDFYSLSGRSEVIPASVLHP